MGLPGAGKIYLARRLVAYLKLFGKITIKYESKLMIGTLVLKAEIDSLKE